MAKKKQSSTTNNTLEIAKLRHATIRRTIDGAYSVCKTSIRSASWVCAAGFFYLTARSLSGHTTRFEAVANGILKFSADRFVMGAVIFMLGGTVVYDRKLRKKIPSNRVQYIRELETRIDPGRTSSRLDESGKPQKEDTDDA